MPRPLYVIGAGGLAKEVGQLARQVDPIASRWSRIAYVAQDSDEVGLSLPYGQVEITDRQFIECNEFCEVVIGIGYPSIRKKISQELGRNENLSFPNLVHPSVELDAKYVFMGIGNILTKGVVITCDIKIGNFNLLNWNVTIGHDVSIGSYNVINPGANISGHVVIEDECLISTGVQIRERTRIASCITLGAGAVLVEDALVPNGVYLGVPARRT